MSDFGTKAASISEWGCASSEECPQLSTLSSTQHAVVDLSTQKTGLSSGS